MKCPRYREFVLALLFVIASPLIAAARPAPRRPMPPELEYGSLPAGRVAALSAGIFDDTTWYGGTCWAADSLRWEALPDSVWTFDTGVGSANSPAAPGKPAGYHARMEGWTGIDFTLPTVNYWHRSSTCAVSGSYSMWAGVPDAEAAALCFVTGRGYGNNWNMEVSRSFNYPGSGNVSLAYAYVVDTEPGFDYAFVRIDTTGDGSAADVTLISYTGAVDGHETLVLKPGTDMRSTPGPITIKFAAVSDGSYSDEDGLFASLCGHSAFDNILLTGAIVDYSNFESGTNGWQPHLPSSAVGDFSDLAWLGDLPAPVTFCPCGARDSVLVFFDTNGQHPVGQENAAASPWIDLARQGDDGRPGRLLRYHIYREGYYSSYVLETLRVRYAPYDCPGGGGEGVSPWQGVYYSLEPPADGCSPAGSPRLRDVSALIPSTARQVQVAIGVASLCDQNPGCNGLGNQSPWYDDISFGVYGSAVAPVVQTYGRDRLQDNFATDGTLNPASSGALDINLIKNAGGPQAGSILGDTLVARGDGGNTEVRLVFHVRPGPLTNPAALAARALRWTTEPAIGAGWYSARMDTAEQAGVIPFLGGQWMGTFHESDPGFRLTDRTADPTRPSQLENEILPDNLFTPGSRIDYFLAARYRPPDPRNPGGQNWYVTPDTTGGRYFEVEILPSSMAADTTWNCTLYVDQHDDRAGGEQQIEESALDFVFGTGGANAEGTWFDRFDNQYPAGSQFSFGRPNLTSYGANAAQVVGYRAIAWHSGPVSSGALTNEDALVLRPWLTLTANPGNRFWGTGDGLATSMQNAGAGSPARLFMNEVLGATRVCDTIYSTNCPSGTGQDTTSCVPLTAAAGAVFTTVGNASARGNGCPQLRSFDLIGLQAGVATAHGQLDYQKAGSSRSFAAVTNAVSSGGQDYRTVLDGFGVGVLRTLSGSPTNAANCTSPAAAYARAASVMSWLGAGGGVCRTPGNVSGIGPDLPRPSAWRLQLSPVTPNPSTDNARIAFTVPDNVRTATVALFDITGRKVRSLLDGDVTAGPHALTWDGRDDDGRRVAPGIYFVRYGAGRAALSRKIIMAR